MTYSFTDEDKIMSPNTYFYTEFNGQEFLDEYFANRELIIELSKEALEPLFVISDTQIKESLIQTSVFLEKTYLSQIADELSSFIPDPQLEKSTIEKENEDSKKAKGQRKIIHGLVVE